MRQAFSSLLIVCAVGLVSHAQPRTSRILELRELRFLKIDALDRERTMFILPIGMLEEHGPHLPIGSDTLGVISIAARHPSAADIASFGLDVHAGVSETSVNLALRPNLVDPGYRKLPANSGRTFDQLQAIATKSGWQGYLSAPAKATAAYGRDIENVVGGRTERSDFARHHDEALADAFQSRLIQRRRAASHASSFASAGTRGLQQVLAAGEPSSGPDRDPDLRSLGGSARVKASTALRTSSASETFSAHRSYPGGATDVGAPQQQTLVR